MFFLIFFLSTILCLLAWNQSRNARRDFLLSKIPCPKKYPIIHNSPEFFNKTPKDIFKWIERTRMAIGPIYQFTFSSFTDPTVVITDPKSVETIMSSQTEITKSDYYFMLKNWLGQGLLTSTGKKWHQRRKVLTPSFHFNILEKFVDVMDDKGKVFIKKLGGFNGQEIDIYQLVTLYAMDVICECAMGCKINAQNENESKYAKAVKEVSQILYERMFDPIRKIDFIYQFTELYRREAKALDVLHGFTDSVIKSRREALVEKTHSEQDNDVGIKSKMALLDLLLQATVDGKRLTNMEIREEVDTFMFEGHDTTTSGISFCLYNLAKYPQVQQKVFEEIQAEVGDVETLTLQHLSKLRYLELVIKESLRIFPSVPYFGRQLAQELDVGDYILPKGSNVFISPFLMGRDPKIFQDPLAFIPERFDVETTYEKINPFAYIPFSAGPRNCIGQKFAMCELKSIICKTIKNFDLSVTNVNDDLGVFGDLVLKTTHGIKLKIKKRNLS